MVGEQPRKIDDLFKSYKLLEQSIVSCIRRRLVPLFLILDNTKLTLNVQNYTCTRWFCLAEFLDVNGEGVW